MPRRLSIALLALTALTPVALHAQEATGAAPSTAGTPPVAAPAPEADTGGLAEIIVTAQRRPENIQNVSLAIQAITATDLARSGITDVTRLDLIAPGVTFAKYGVDAKISLRGANSNNTFLDASPSVGVFIDGVYRPSASQQTQSFFDVSRVEVLKGPQGTLYGRNTLAGAVNLWTNTPDPSKFAVGFTVGYARFADFRQEGYVNIPLTDRLAFRFAEFVEKGDGFVENLYGPRLGNPEKYGVRGSLKYVGPRGDLTLRVQNVSDRGNQTGLFAFNGACRQVTPQGLTDPYGTVTDCQNPRRGAAGAPAWNALGKLTVQRGLVPRNQVDEFSGTLEFNAPLAKWLGARGVFSYTEFSDNLGQANNFAATPYALDLYRQKIKSWTNELQLSTKGNGPIKATIGGYASRDEIDFLSAALRYFPDNQGVRPLVAVPGFGNCASTPRVFCLPVLIATPLTSTIVDVGNPLTLNAALRPTRDGRSSNNFQFLNTNTFGGFGQASYAIVPKLRIVGGVRYSVEVKDAINYGGPQSTTTFQGPQFPGFINLDIGQFSTAKSLATSSTRRKYDNVTWRAALEYDLAPRVLLFFTTSTGFLSGSLNTDGSNTDQQKSINFEGGIKSRFFDNKLQVNGSVYHVEYDNLITSFQRPNSSGGVDTIGVNGGAINSTGAELLIEARPVQDLRLSVGVSYLDAKFGRYTILAPYQLVNGNPTTTGRFINLQGITPQFAPKWQTTLIGQYDIHLGHAGKLTPAVQFYYSDTYSAQTQVSFLDRAGTQPSFTKTDLRLTWTDASDRFSIEGYVENIEDEVVNLRTTYGGDGIEQVTYGYPRNYGGRLRMRF